MFTALGRNRLAIVFCCSDIALNGAVIAYFAPHGLLVLARATVIPMAISGALSLSAILFVIRTRLRDYAKAVLPAYIAAAVMSAALLATAHGLSGQPPLIRLLVCVLLSILAYAGVLAVFFQPWLKGALGFIRSRRSI